MYLKYILQKINHDVSCMHGVWRERDQSPAFARDF